MIDALWQSLDPAEQKVVDRAWLAESRRMNPGALGRARQFRPTPAQGRAEFTLIPRKSAHKIRMN